MSSFRSIDPNQKWIHDVFLSFSCEDSLTSFTSHLCSYLKHAGASVDEHLRIGSNQISSSLLQKMESSRASIIVLSKHYVSSKWCLDELEKIIECHKTTSQAVVPVFYNVDPSEVRHLKGSFGEAFEDFIKRKSVKKDKALSWRTALIEVGSIEGVVVTDDGKESEDVKNVVEYVTSVLDIRDSIVVDDDMVGVESRVQDVIKLLDNHNFKDVQILGIWGMGGIGKTIIAKAVYNQIGCNFESTSFLQNIRDVWEQMNGQVSLQEKLLSDIYKTSKAKIQGIEEGKIVIKKGLCHRKILLILDDVNKLEQLNALCGSREWFGLGSIIIITTRDKRLLSVLGVDHVYRMKEMNESESLELFSKHAFREPSPREDFTEVSRDAVVYSGGLPLALVVLGSLLFGRSVGECKSTLETIRRRPHNDIQRVLKLSFDGLSDDKEKEIFLDIVYFSMGMDLHNEMGLSDVIERLNRFGLFAENAINVLVDRSLIIIDEKNKLSMHVLLQEMGREIIRERSQGPGVSSKLSFHSKILDL